jgi:predicted metal-binding membrane protein
VAITTLLVVEKLGRRGLLLGRAAGAALVAWSVVALAGWG